MNRIKELREAAGLTVSGLADIIGAGTASVCKWENGTVVPSVYAAYKMAKEFGVSIEYLMGYKQTRKEAQTAPTLAPSNEPLTPEEMREMVGQPVWTVGVSYTDDGNWAMWDIVESIDKDGITFGYSTESREWWNYNLRDAQGNLMGCAWTCYRQPPKEYK